jgi:hypothetical protein
VLRKKLLIHLSVIAYSACQAGEGASSAPKGAGIETNPDLGAGCARAWFQGTSTSSIAGGRDEPRGE